MQLDPACAGVEAAPRLRNGVALRVEAAERGQPPVRGGRCGNDVIVRGRIAVRLVHRHRDSPRSGCLERRRQLLGREREAVGVVEADVPVDVHQRHPRGELAGVLVPGPDQLVVVEQARRRDDDELERRLADPDHVARLEPGPLDASAVDPGAVARAEILDHERTVVVAANGGVPAGELCVRRQAFEPRRRPPELELRVDPELQPGSRPCCRAQGLAGHQASTTRARPRACSSSRYGLLASPAVAARSALRKSGIGLPSGVSGSPPSCSRSAITRQARRVRATE